MVSTRQFQRAMLFEALKFRWLLSWWTSESGFFNADPSQVAGQNRYNGIQNQLGTTLNFKIVQMQAHNGTTNSFNFGFAGNTTKGNYVILSMVMVTGNVATSANPTITDSFSNNLTRDEDSYVTNGGVEVIQGHFPVMASTGSYSITVGIAGGASWETLITAYEVQGLQSPTAPTHTGSSPTCGTPIVNTTTTGKLTLSAIGSYNLGSGVYSFSGPYTDNSDNTAIGLDGRGSGAYSTTSCTSIGTIVYGEASYS